MGTDQMAIFAAYRRLGHAEKAKQLLLGAGFTDKGICLMASRKGDGKSFHEQVRTSLQKGALVGALAGGSAFLVVGIALSLSIFVMPGQVTHSHIPVATRIALTLAGVVIGSLVGMFAGTLVGIGTPERVTQRFAGYAKGGGTVLSVEVNDSADTDRASKIFEQTGGSDITEMNEREGWKTIHDEIQERSPDESQLLNNDEIPR